MGLTSHGFVTQVTVIIPAGDGGKLHLRPYVELPGKLSRSFASMLGILIYQVMM